jgi:O-antigen/teichoic acid export membrane protein
MQIKNLIKSKFNKHDLDTILYLIGRGIPGVLNFLLISIYSEYVPIENYGVFAIINTTLLFLNFFLFQPIRLFVLRFNGVESKSDGVNALKNIGQLFMFSMIIGIIILFIIIILYYKYTYVHFLVATLLLIFLNITEIGLEYLRASLNSKKYSIINIVRVVATFGLSYFVLSLQFYEIGILFSLLISYFLVTVLFFKKVTLEIISNISNWSITNNIKYFSYSIPLIISSFFVFLNNYLDRYIIHDFLGPKSLGIYTMAFDITKQSIWIVMSSLVSATYPLAVNSFENGDLELTDIYLKKGLVYLLTFSIPLVAVLFLRSDELLTLFLSEKINVQVAEFIPLLSIGALISGIKTFFIDLSFQIGKKTNLQYISSVYSTFFNLILNIILVPKYGIISAVWVTLFTNVLECVLSILYSRKSYKLSYHKKKTIQIIISLLGMLIILNYSRFFVEISTIWEILISIVFYISGVLFFGILKNDYKIREI